MILKVNIFVINLILSLWKGQLIGQVINHNFKFLILLILELALTFEVGGGGNIETIGGGIGFIYGGNTNYSKGHEEH